MKTRTLFIILPVIISVSCAPAVIATPTETAVSTLTIMPNPPTSTRTPTARPTNTPTPTPDLNNLDFENDGGWEINQNQNKWPYFYGNYSTEWASRGERSLKLYHHAPDCYDFVSHTWDRVEISQVVDLTDVKAIEFDVAPVVTVGRGSGWEHNAAYGQGVALEVYIDKILVKTIDEMPGQLLDQYALTEGRTGTHTLRFRFRPLRDGSWCIEVGVYIDNIRLLNQSQSLPPPPAANLINIFPSAHLTTQDNWWNGDYGPIPLQSPIVPFQKL